MVTHEQAEKRVELGFLIHLGVYVPVVAGLAALNFSRHPEKPWSLWVAGGWGLGVALHGMLVHFVPEARERMIERTTARMERRARTHERLSRHQAPAEHHQT